MTTAAKSPRSLFLEAVENHSPERWSDFLDVACGDDANLRDQVTRLLDAHGQLSGFMAHPAAQPLLETNDSPTGQFVGQTIGRYKLFEQVGEGGMGIIYVAEQTVPVLCPNRGFDTSPIPLLRRLSKQSVDGRKAVLRS